MKLSKYSIFVDDYPQAGKYLTYNTKTQALVVLNSQIHSLLQKTPVPVEELPKETRPIMTQLQNMGVTVPDHEDELDLMRGWFEKVRYNAKKLDVFLLTSYFCNFACPYCFEGKVKEQKKFLNEQRADDVIRWIQNKAAELNPEKVVITFYGGEPLMNIPGLEYVAEKLHNWFKNTPWRFGFNIITNGALVSEKLVDRLNPLGLWNIRITIDGDKEHHDQYRPFISGKGTFDVIMRNIKAVADKTNIVLLCNFNTESYPGLYKFLDYLEAEGLKKKISQIDCNPIAERAEEVDPNSLAQSDYECDAHHSDKMVAIKKEIIRRGFNTAKALDGSGICHLKGADHQVIIDTDGMIYKCPAWVGHAEKACGTVHEDIRQNAKYQEFMSFDLVEWEGKCSTCEYLPFCAGGCNYHAELQSGDYQNTFCEKKYFDKTIKEFIKMRYQQMTARQALKESGVKVAARS